MKIKVDIGDPGAFESIRDHNRRICAFIIMKINEFSIINGSLPRVVLVGTDILYKLYDMDIFAINIDTNMKSSRILPDSVGIFGGTPMYHDIMNVNGAEYIELFPNVSEMFNKYKFSWV